MKSDTTTTFRPLSHWFVLLLAISTGVFVASNYYAQPLLNTISHDLNVSTNSIGIIITVAQLFYAAGLLLLVPLGDLVEKRKLIISMSIISILGLLVCATAQNFIWLLIGTAITSFFAVAAQIIVPFAATLANPIERGKVIGTIMSGLLIGILLARTAAGFFSEIGNWQTIYYIAALILSIITLLLLKTLPYYPVSNKMPYPYLLLSTLGQFIKHPRLITYGILGVLNFSVFSLLWTPIALLLGKSPYHYNDAIIGLFGLIGAAGALMAPYTGKLADKGKSNLVITLGFVSLIVSWLPLAFAEKSLILLIIGILILDLAVQSIHVTTMNKVYQIDPESRSRLNACYMACYFIGGALGSFASTRLFSYFGWLGVVITAIIIATMGLIVWLVFYPASKDDHS